MARSLHTPLCDLLGIRYPILNAGIGPAAGPELAAAVTNAGGFGVLGGGGMPHEAMRRRVARTRALTKGPFGINLIVDETAAAEDLEHAEGLVAMSPAVIVLFWGDPTPYVPMAHSRDVKVLVQVGSLDEARRAAKAGVDGVFAQGVEAGGHVRGTTPIWDLLPAVVKAIKPTPVLASGGIGDGAGLARAIQLGAQGASLGTRFVACDEAWLHPAYKQRVVEARAEDTVLNELYDYDWPDAPHRTLKNTTFAEWVAAGSPPRGSKPGEGKSIGKRSNPMGERVEWMRYAIGAAPPDFDGDIEYAPLWCGESCSVVNDIKPAAQIVSDLVREAEGALGA
jgi:nitronate monooxygenase